MSSDYSWLNRPLQVGKLTLKHRMIMGPMGNRMWTATGEPRPGLIEFGDVIHEGTRVAREI